MTSLSLRRRIIVALVALALGTTLALSLLTRRWMDRTLGMSINLEVEQVLSDALTLAKDNYDRRKAAMGAMGEKLAEFPVLAESYRRGDLQPLRDFLDREGFTDTPIRFASPVAGLPEPVAATLGDGPQIFKDPEEKNLLQLAVPVVHGDEIVAALIAAEPLGQLLKVEAAMQTYGHVQMLETDLRRGFLLEFLVAAAAVVLLASLVGIRIGIEITGPLHALVTGTRELARDNLDYRIPPAREDEIGLLIGSFNRMAEDLKMNRRQRLEAEKIAAWREIARRLAHEIKNPLTPIQLTVQQIRDKYTGDDPVYRKLIEDCTEIVTEEVESLRGLVQEFADFARMPALSLERQDLNAVIRDVVVLYPDARIERDLQPDLPALDIDAEQMRRVLINLIENGIEAAGDDAVLTIRTRAAGETAGMVVIDPGPGVNAVDRVRIFQPYVSTKQSGMGLGLAVVRSVVENHGGRVTVTDAPGKGAQFEVLLPIPEESAKRPEVRL